MQHEKPRPPRIVHEPISPSGRALWLCTQVERHEWIRQLAPDVPDCGGATLLARPEWFRGYEIAPLDSFTPGIGACEHYRLYYRDRRGSL